MSNFCCRLDGDLCTGCGACVSRCPTRALKLADDRVRLNAERCIGCGLCQGECPLGALTLVRKSEENLYTPPETAFAAYERMSGEVSQPDLG